MPGNKKSFADLQKENALLRAVVDNASDVVFVKDLNGRYLMINPAGAAFLGKQIEEIIGRTDSELFSGEDAEKLTIWNRQAATCEKPITIEKALSYGGKPRFFHAIKGAYCDSQGKVIGTFGISRDITKRKKAEELLCEAQARTESVLASVVDVHILFDREWHYLYVNEAALRAIGRPRDEILGRTQWELYPDIVGTELARHYHRAMDERIPVVFDSYYPTTDTWWHNRFYPTAEGLAVFATEITEQKRADAAAELAGERFRRIIDSNIVGIVIANAAGHILEANDYYLNLIGHSRDELTQGKVDWRAITPPEWHSADEKALDELRRRGVCTPYEKEYLLRDGSRVPVFLADTMLPGPGGQIAAFVLDITERKKAEQELMVNSQRLEELNTALKVILDQRDREKKDLEENFTGNITGLILPYLEKIGKTDLTPLQQEYMHVLETNLREIVKPYDQRVSAKLLQLSRAETRIMNYIKQGRSIKEIASLLHISPRTVEFHRDSLRRKLGIKNSKINLKTYLASLE